MNSEARFVLAIVLMLGVLVGTNLLFPPPPPSPDSAGEPGIEAPGSGGSEGATAAGDPAIPAPTGEAGVPSEPAAGVDPTLPQLTPETPVPAVVVADERVTEQRIVAEGPLWRYEFSTLGARAQSIQLLRFVAPERRGPVELVRPDGAGFFGNRIVVGADTVDLRRVPYTVSPEGGLHFEEGDEPAELIFTYTHPTQPFSVEVSYRFDPASYVVDVSGRVRGLERGLLVTDLGEGLAFNEVDPAVESRSMAYVASHLQEGIRSEENTKVDSSHVANGPFLWAALKSQYFLVAAIPNGSWEGGDLFGGMLIESLPEEEGSVRIGVTRSLGAGGVFSHRILAGPQDYALLSSFGNGLQEVNPYGWRFLRPLLRPVVAVIMWVLVGLHETLSIGYGWVLILFGVMMRVVLFPLNHKAMKAQLRNLAVQPLLKDIQTKYKDQPEKLQKELMKLYKEHGFNPLAGCWPMLLPWPVLIALFFVFQNTIELRGVPFAWLTDLSAKDPFYILPVLLGVSMFFLQWVTIRTMEEVNPQMKMMMWLLPPFMAFIFAQFPSGLNLYYLTANIATLPQSWWIANERLKVQAKGPPKGPTTGPPKGSSKGPAVPAKA